MQTAVYQTNLQTLGHQLQTLFDDVPLSVRCILSDEKLIVVGQHPADTCLDSTQTLRALERTIQSLRLDFTQQVRLYLRVTGQQHPYAHRYFKIQPSAPPPNPTLCLVGQGERRESWIPGDDELSVLMHQLLDSTPQIEVSTALSVASGAEMVPFTSSSLAVPQSESDVAIPEPPRPRWLNRQMLAAMGFSALGLTAGVYEATRPCVMGACPELQNAQTLGLRSAQAMQSAKTRQDLEAAQQPLSQAVAGLKTIPVWSSYHSEAQRLMQRYQDQTSTLKQATGVEDIAAIALQKSQTPPYSTNDWQTIRALWQSAVNQLEQISPVSELYPFAQQQLQLYRDRLTIADQQLQLEQRGQQVIEGSRGVARLAETREGVAKNRADWQLAQATWREAADRLQQVPPTTVAAGQAQQMQAVYASESMRVSDRINQEESAAKTLEQANQQALKAQTNQQNFDWQQAVADWNTAITYVKQIPSDTAYQPQAAALMTAYTNALNQAEQKLQLEKRVQVDLNKLCMGEIKACNLIGVGSVIKVQLEPDYVQAIAVAKEIGNQSLQAIVAEDQLKLKRSLEKLATNFRLPVEVYDANQALLDRHLPQ